MTTLERRFDVVSAEQLERLAARPGATGVSTAIANAARVLYRDLYIDTDDDLLQRRGITCRLRVGSDDRRTLTLIVGAPGDSTPTRRYDARVNSADPRIALAEDVEPARRLAAVADMRLLQTRMELQIERIERLERRDWLGRARLALFFDRVHVRCGAVSRAFHQVTVRAAARDAETFEALCADLQDREGLRPIVAGTRERAQLLLKWMNSEQAGRSAADSGVTLVLVRGNAFAMLQRENGLSLPIAHGAGVGAARTLLDACAPTPASDVRLLGKITAIGPMPALEVWTAEIAEAGAVRVEGADTRWLDAGTALARAPELLPDAVGALAVALRAGLLAENEGGGPARRSVELSGWGRAFGASAEGEAAFGDPRFLNAELGILQFTARVLALAEDVRTPLIERLRFLAIVGQNLDEFFMVRVAGLKRSALEQAEERTPDGLTPRQQLDLIAAHAHAIMARQYRCAEACLAQTAASGGAARVTSWSALDAAARDELRVAFRDELLPALTPLAMTLSPGHPFPRLRHLSLSLAVVLLDRPGAAPHFAQVELPADAPRFTAVPGSDAVIPIEELVRANLDLLYPASVIEQAYAFRVTRGADLELGDERPASLIAAVEEASRKRYDQPVVRVEVERAMPAVLRDIVLRELGREHGGSTLDEDDLYEVDGLLDLSALAELPLPVIPGAEFAGFRGAPGLPPGDLWQVIDAGDRLLHHPFDDYEASVVRFFREAADDPDVTAIKMTLYRAGASSPIVSALMDAASRGKDVVVFVELKARFDEERNVAWARRLEAAGGRVVHGLPGVKNHAKVAMVVRRASDGRLRRYVHVGTGNYNAATAARYTDLSLLTADPLLAGDVQDFFNALTGSASAPLQLSNGSLISPRQILPELIARIEREAAHARAGRGGHVRIKVNGLSDPDVVSALFRASQDGVRVELVVRGLCTLRPGVPGSSENVRIVSVLGRFLEHGRVFHFANAGDPEYYIGSADLRPRNLRRRVELLVPVRDADCRARLAALLDAYLGDPTAWELTAAGEYVRGRGAGPGVQDALLSAVTTPAGAA